MGHIVFDHATARNLRCAVHSALCLGVDLVYRWRWPELTRSPKTRDLKFSSRRRCREQAARISAAGRDAAFAKSWRRKVNYIHFPFIAGGEKSKVERCGA